ncbi:MAG: stage II sporulation protein M [Verrucomicrobiota bacterium]
MIIDLPRFIAIERPSWEALEQMLDAMEGSPSDPLPLEKARQFYFLYQKVSADLARIATFASEPELRRYLESLIARAYAEIHETRDRGRRLAFVRWFGVDFPAVFRRHFQAFFLALLVTLAGVVFGGMAVGLDPEAKEAVLPEMFSSHLGDPAKRVAEEEKGTRNHLKGAHATFASQLMVNNIRVSIMALALGMTFGVGTLISLFYNGVILGLVAVDYIRAGESVFLLGWLMPHGVIEIPAILIAGQAGLLLGKALIGRGDRFPLRMRLRAIGADVMTLIGGVAVMLVWAGLIESFLSQHHEPAISYGAKIAFGTAELAALIWFLGWSGKKREAEARR